MAKQEVAQPQSQSRLDRLAIHLAQRATVEEDDPGTAMDSIAERNLAAETLEELWDADEGGMPNGKAVVDIEQRIFTFETRKSNDPEIANPKLGNTYLIVHAARLDTGEEFAWQTSAPLLVTKLIQIERMDKLPVDCVVRSVDLGGGNAVLRLRPLTV